MNLHDLTPLQKRRAVRYGALAVVLLAGLIFHQKSGGYAVIRIIYFAVILGLFFTRTWYGSSRRRAGASTTGGGLFGLWARRSRGGVTNTGGSMPPAHKLGAPGWVRDGVDPSIERYWDGSSWTRNRRWNGREWIEGG